MHLHCTKKLIKQLGLSSADLDPSHPENRLLSWHAHIVFIARSKTLVAVNDQTFYAVIMPRIKKKRLDQFADEFRSALSRSMKSDGFSDHHLEFLTGERILYAKAHNRQVLGIINEAVFHIRYLVEREGGWDRTQCCGSDQADQPHPLACGDSELRVPSRENG
ncbi:MAG: hypothetical protein HY543_11595 [Deltaproteobacteria bacterium]|nr:hypothetical protein [Deltaproteobacteria bacterium]